MQKNSTPDQLILFAKAPFPGKVKTRMQPHLSPEQALMLYRAMGEDLVAQLGDSPHYDFCVYYAPSESREAVASWLGTSLALCPQRAGNLGERMAAAFQESLQHYQRVVIIGCDLPTLTEQEVRNAFGALEDADLVLGPTEDGGYYLIGLKQYHPVVFEDIHWSSEAVLAQTLERARQAGLTVHLLPKQRDLDTYADLQALWRQLQKKAAVSNHFPGRRVFETAERWLSRSFGKAAF